MSSDTISQVMKERQGKYQNATPYPNALKKEKNATHKQHVLNHQSYTKVQTLYQSLLDEVAK